MLDLLKLRFLTSNWKTEFSNATPIITGNFDTPDKVAISCDVAFDRRGNRRSYVGAQFVGQILIE